MKRGSAFSFFKRMCLAELHIFSFSGERTPSELTTECYHDLASLNGVRLVKLVTGC